MRKRTVLLLVCLLTICLSVAFTACNNKDKDDVTTRTFSASSAYESFKVSINNDGTFTYETNKSYGFDTTIVRGSGKYVIDADTKEISFSDFSATREYYTWNTLHKTESAEVKLFDPGCIHSLDGRLLIASYMGNMLALVEDGATIENKEIACITRKQVLYPKVAYFFSKGQEIASTQTFEYYLKYIDDSSETKNFLFKDMTTKFDTSTVGYKQAVADGRTFTYYVYDPAATTVNQDMLVVHYQGKDFLVKGEAEEYLLSYISVYANGQYIDSGYTIEGFDTSAVGKMTVTVKYKGAEYGLDIDVIEETAVLDLELFDNEAYPVGISENDFKKSVSASYMSSDFERKDVTFENGLSLVSAFDSSEGVKILRFKYTVSATEEYELSTVVRFYKPEDGGKIFWSAVDIDLNGNKVVSDANGNLSISGNNQMFAKYYAHDNQEHSQKISKEDIKLSTLEYTPQNARISCQYACEFDGHTYYFEVLSFVDIQQ